MNRRDLLRLRPPSRERTLDLSCRSLYKRYLDSEALAASASGRPVVDDEAWMGPPPTPFAPRTVEALLHQIVADLHNVDVVRVIDDEWLAATGLRQRIEPVLTSFRARGGRVEFTKGEQKIE